MDFISADRKVIFLFMEMIADFTKWKKLTEQLLFKTAIARSAVMDFFILGKYKYDLAVDSLRESNSNLPSKPWDMM